MEETDHLLDLLQSDDPNQRSSALESLPETFSERITMALIDMLRDDNLSLRQRSMTALIQHGSSSIESLIEALRINDYDIRFNIIRILGAIGDQRATAHLTHLAEHAPDSLQYEITEALVHVKDPQTIDALVSALGNKEPSIRELAKKGLVNLGTVALPTLCSALNSPLWLTRTYAARILGTLRDKRALDPLISSLQHPDSSFRIEVIKALGALGDRHAVVPLSNLLAQNDQETTRPLIESLAQLQDLRAVRLMVESFKVEDWQQHEYIVSSIASLGKRVIKHLEGFTENSSPLVRIGIAKILSRFTDSNATPMLIRLSKDADQEVRKIAAAALARRKDTSSIQALITLIGDSSSTVSALAAKGLIRHAPHSRDALVEALCDADPKIRGRAATLLCRKDLHEEAATPFDLPAHCTPYLMDSLREEPPYRKYVAYLLRHVKGDPMASRVGLIYQGHSQITARIDELRRLNRWEHLSLLSEDLNKLTANLDRSEAKSAFQALKETAKEQRKTIKDGYCLLHYARFIPHRISNIEFLGCRVCHSTIFGANVPVVYLVLDRTLERDAEVFTDKVIINRLKHLHPVDFNHIHIGPCEKEDIRSLCIELGNDTDPLRRKAYINAHCSIGAGANVDDEIFNLLSNQFKSVHFVR